MIAEARGYLLLGSWGVPGARQLVAAARAQVGRAGHTGVARAYPLVGVEG